MRGKIQLQITVTLTWLAITCAHAAPANLPAGLTSAAQAGLQRFVSELSASELEKLGLPGKDTLTLATLGKPFQVYHVLPNLPATAATNTTISQIASPSTLWYFPVLIGARARAVVFVDLVQSQWKGVSLGHLALADELKTIQDRWPETGGYHPRLLVSHQANRQFFTVPEVDNVNMTPLSFDANTSIQNSVKALAPKYSRLEKCSDHLPKLKRDIDAAITHERPH